MIYKYSLEVTARQEIEIPFASSFLCLQMQREVPCVWFSISQGSLPKTKIIIHTVGTGNPFPKTSGPDKYAGTYQLGDFVGHVFFEFDPDSLMQKEVRY